MSSGSVGELNLTIITMLTFPSSLWLTAEPAGHCRTGQSTKAPSVPPPSPHACQKQPLHRPWKRLKAQEIPWLGIIIVDEVVLEVVVVEEEGVVVVEMLLLMEAVVIVVVKEEVVVVVMDEEVVKEEVAEEEVVVEEVVVDEEAQEIPIRPSLIMEVVVIVVVVEELVVVKEVVVVDEVVVVEKEMVVVEVVVMVVVMEVAEVKGVVMEENLMNEGAKKRIDLATKFGGKKIPRTDHYGVHSTYSSCLHKDDL
ncbi:unnamed protein product [Merluccius merluccius]